MFYFIPRHTYTDTQSLKCQETTSIFSSSNAKAFDCVDHNKLWKSLQEMGIPDHLTCLLRNLYAGQEATVRTGRLCIVTLLI